MLACRLAFWCHGASQQRMPHRNRTKEFIAEDGPGAHFRREHSEHSNLEIDTSFPERTSIFDGLGRETQPDPWRSFGDGSRQGCGEQFNEPLVGANGEGSPKSGDVQLAGLRAENRPYVTGELMNLVPQFGSPWCRHKPAPACSSSGSPVADRSRARVRLIAEELKPRRGAAPVTLPSVSSASSATRRFRSTLSTAEVYPICLARYSAWCTSGVEVMRLAPAGLIAQIRCGSFK